MKISYVYKKSDKTFTVTPWRSEYTGEPTTTHNYWEVGFYDPLGKYVVSEYVTGSQMAFERVCALNSKKGTKQKSHNYDSAYAGWGEP